MLRTMKEQLNEIHRVDHSLRYWRILVGPWLGYFTQPLFDRWESVHQATTTQELSGSRLCFSLISKMNFGEGLR